MNNFAELSDGDSAKFLVRWRGRQEGPYLASVIEAKLAANEISLLHEIFYNGKWVTIRDYITEREAILRAELQAQVDQAREDQNRASAETERQATIQENYSILSIGDIGITKDKVITPNGIGSLADSQWIFSDMSRTESKIPTTAIILAIVFALLCLIGLLFLLMRETIITGYAEVSVHSGNLYHKIQIPVKSKGDVDRIRELVNKAQSLAAQAR
jgi:hypothetical protein